MKKGRFLWSAHRITERQKAGKARSIKGKQLKNSRSTDLKQAEEVPLTIVKRRMRCEPISIDSNMEDLVSKAMNQNFVPVIDDKGIFIGIVTRKDIIEFCYKAYTKTEKTI